MNFAPKLTHGLHDRYCNECGALLVKVFPDGSHQSVADVAVNIKGEMNPETGEVVSASLEATCLKCNPENLTGLPPEVEELLRKLLSGAPEKVAPAIKTPWNGGGEL